MPSVLDTKHALRVVRASSVDGHFREASVARRNNWRHVVLSASVRVGVALSAALAFIGLLVSAPAQPAAAYPLGPGYSLVASDGGIFTFGQSQFYGSAGGHPLNAPVVGAAEDPFLEGYWLVASDGGVFAYGSAGFYGSAGGHHLNQPIVGMAPTPSGLGYWLVAADGGVFSFGDAHYFGSTGAHPLNQPVVGMAATPDGQGYWLVAADGGIFSFGDAHYYGSTGGYRINAPVVGMAATPDGGGYWLVASDGGIFSFGDAKFYGSTGGYHLNKPVVGMGATPNGKGYWLVAADGGIFTFGDAGFHGSTGAMTLNKPVIAMLVRPTLAVKVDPYVPETGESSNWVNTGSGWQLQLNNAGGGSVPAGARVLGVAGIDVSQLQTLGFTVASGVCSGATPYFLLTAYDPTTKAIDIRSYDCAKGGGAGGVETFDPVTGVSGGGGAAPLPSNDVVESLDIVQVTPGTSTALTDIQVAGLTITDYRTFTQAGTIIG